MIEVSPGLFVGSGEDWAELQELRADEMGNDEWAVLHASKKVHKELLGYSGWAAPKDSPEYLQAERSEPCARMALNMIDADKPEYLPADMIKAGVAFVHRHMDEGRKVLVHCDQGASRSSLMAMMALATTDLAAMPHGEALEAFKALYPACAMGKGTAGYLEANWPWKAQQDDAAEVAAE